jgi:hypothetical protein
MVSPLYSTRPLHRKTPTKEEKERLPSANHGNLGDKLEQYEHISVCHQHRIYNSDYITQNYA